MLVIPADGSGNCQDLLSQFDACLWWTGMGVSASPLAFSPRQFNPDIQVQNLKIVFVGHCCLGMPCHFPPKILFHSLTIGFLCEYYSHDTDFVIPLSVSSRRVLGYNWVTTSIPDKFHCLLYHCFSHPQIPGYQEYHIPLSSESLNTTVLPISESRDSRNIPY